MRRQSGRYHARRLTPLRDVKRFASSVLAFAHAAGVSAETTPKDSHALVAALARDAVRLDLNTYDLCCLAGLHLRADRDALASFTDEDVLDLFEQMCELVDPGAENPRKRATHAIQRLRDGRMLVRVDGAGVVRAGEYALTRLATGVVSFYLEDEALTRESLTLLTRTLLAQLAEIKAAASWAVDAEDWTQKVIAPLRVTVADLIQGIDRRQRGLDVAQEQVQADIAGLIESDWFAAVDEAQELLDTTTDTLRELNDVLLRDTHQFVALLQEIQDEAQSKDVLEAQEVAQRVIEQVDKIGSWGEARQRAWSGYYQYVHRYLRDVVRLDPDRALSQRLRNQLTEWPLRPFALALSAEASLRILREVPTRIDRPVVSRSRADRERRPEEVPVRSEEAILENAVLTALDAGAATLSEVTEAVLEGLPEELRFDSAGRIAAIVADRVRPRVERERRWTRVSDAFEIQQWTLSRGKRR